MRLHRFYVQQPLGEEVVIDDVSIISQWLKVLRYESGDVVTLFNGDTYDHTYTITEVTKKSCTLRKTSATRAYTPEHKSYLYLSIIKKDLFELVTEKATELGITDIIPIVSERTGKKNLDYRRLELTTKEASEQSGRGDIPLIHAEMKLPDALLFAKETTPGNVFVASLFGTSVTSIKINPGTLSIIIGPEGGWTDTEEELFKDTTIRTFSLGGTTLRAETAAIAATALLLLK